MLSHLVDMLLMRINILLKLSIQLIKDLGITFDVKLNFSLHISEWLTRLGIIKET